MPGLYQHGDFDLAGFAVGVVEEKKIISGNKVKPGHAIIGVASSGIHSNGFSYVRKVLNREFMLEHAEEILKPTKIYVKSVLALLTKEEVFSMAHVTGGGFFDNIPRVLPKGCGAKIQTGSWTTPRVFKWIQEAGNASTREMYRTFNMGIGFLLVVPKECAQKVVNHFAKFDERAWVIGEIVKGEGVVVQ